MLQHNPPLPIGATFSVATHDLTVTFDRLLAPGASAAANWLYKLGNGPPTSYIGLGPGVIAGDNVVVPMVFGGLGLPPLDTCNYLAAPPDVTSKRTGLPAAAFVGLPVLKIP